jgi:hypothetical protein
MLLYTHLQRVVGFIREHGLEKEVQFSTFPDGGFTLWESRDQMEREKRDLGCQAAAGVTTHAEHSIGLSGPVSNCTSLPASVFSVRT